MNLKFWETGEKSMTQEQVDAVSDKRDNESSERINRQMRASRMRIDQETAEDIEETAGLTLLEKVVDSKASGGSAVSAPHIELHVENLVVTDPDLMEALFSVAEGIDESSE